MKHQVVILAGGESSRFFPFNKLHKSFFKIFGKSIIEYTLESVKKTNPSQIVVVLAADNFEEEKKILVDHGYGENITFVSQESSQGMADAILSAKEHISDSFFVINSQHFHFDSFYSKFDEAFTNGNCLAAIGSAETDEPQKYGIFKFDGDKVMGIEEKPKSGFEPSNKRVVGVYLFAKEFIAELEKTEIFEYSLEKTLDRIARNGEVVAVNVGRDLPSLKYPWDVLKIKDHLFEKLEFKIHKSAVIEKTAVLKGRQIFIAEGARVCDFAIIEGPAYVGKNVVVGAYSQIRVGTVLEDHSQIERYMDVRNSYIGSGTHIHSGFVGDSVIGVDGRIGANFITANKRLDRREVETRVKGERVNSGLINFGVVIGNKVSVGINASTMPGVIIGSECQVYPGTITKGVFGDNLKIGVAPKTETD